MSALIATVLVFGMFAVFTPQAPADPSGKVVVFVTGYGIGTNGLSEIQTWLEGLGATVRIATVLNATVLSGADALILAGPYGPATGIEEFNATNAPGFFQTIWNWWNGTAGGVGGGKFLWVGSDSDYGGRDWIAGNASLVLETVGSHLRHEPTSIEDPISNCQASYRVVPNVTVTTGDAATITAGITHGALFHGPTLLYGVNGTGHDVALHNNSIPGVFNILLTNDTGVVVDGNPLIPPLTVTDAQIGNFVMMAGEKDIGYFSNNRVIATGASPYGDYEPMWTDTYYSTYMNGSTLVKQAILWGLEATSVIVPGPPSTPILVGPSEVYDGLIQVNWTGAIDDTGILRYTVVMSNSSTFAIAVIAVNVSGMTHTHTFDVTGFGAGTYYFHVRAVDTEENAGEWSNMVSTTYTIIIPPPPPIPGFPFEAIILGLAAIIVPVIVIRRRRK